MKVYRILGRKAQLVTFADKNDKVLPAGTVFFAPKGNASVMRLMRIKPPACRELVGDEIPEGFRGDEPEQIYVVLDGE